MDAKGELIKRQDELIKVLYDCLDDEVGFCNANGHEVSAKSVEVLETCQSIGYGKSVALKDLERKDKREKLQILSVQENINIMRGPEEEGID